MRPGSSTRSFRCSGWSERSFPLQPMSLAVVSLPAPARRLTEVRISVRVRRRVVPVSSWNSALSSAVIRSSEGCSSRHSMYSANIAPSKCERSASFAPGALRDACRSCTAIWSLSGMPSNMPMTRAATIAAKSWTKSKPSLPTNGSRHRAQNSRTSGSRASIFFGVKTRDSRPRCMVCCGGSSKMNMPGGKSTSALMNSRMLERPLMSRLLSVKARSTSSARLTA